MGLTWLETFIVASIVTARRLPAILLDGVRECSASGLLPRLIHSSGSAQCYGAAAIIARFLRFWGARLCHIYILNLLLREGLLWREVRRRCPGVYVG